MPTVCIYSCALYIKKFFHPSTISFHPLGETSSPLHPPHCPWGLCKSGWAEGHFFKGDLFCLPERGPSWELRHHEAKAEAKPTSVQFPFHPAQFPSATFPHLWSEGTKTEGTAPHRPWSRCELAMSRLAEGGPCGWRSGEKGRSRWDHCGTWGKVWVLSYGQWEAMEESEEGRNMTCMDGSKASGWSQNGLPTGVSDWLSRVMSPCSSCKGCWKTSLIFSASFVRCRICS